MRYRAASYSVRRRYGADTLLKKHTLVQGAVNLQAVISFIFSLLANLFV
jgi:hypothetical protein